MRDRHPAGLPFAHTHSTSCVCVCDFPRRLAKAQLLSKCHRRVSVGPCCAGLPHSRFAPLCGQPVPAISASITERCVNPAQHRKKVRLPPARAHSATSVPSTLQRTSLRPPAGRCYLALSDATQSDALSIILQDFSSFFFFFGAALLCPA